MKKFLPFHWKTMFFIIVVITIILSLSSCLSEKRCQKCLDKYANTMSQSDSTNTVIKITPHDTTVVFGSDTISFQYLLGDSWSPSEIEQDTAWVLFPPVFDTILNSNRAHTHIVLKDKKLMVTSTCDSLVAKIRWQDSTISFFRSHKSIQTLPIRYVKYFPWYIKYLCFPFALIGLTLVSIRIGKMLARRSV